MADAARRFYSHSFRATGITNFLENDGTLEAAQRVAGHVVFALVGEPLHLG
jgi:hypothetical protein